MEPQPPPQRVAVVVHPSRPIAEPLATLARWAEANGLEIVEIVGADAIDRDIAPAGVAAPGDLIVALGGDGTVLTALRTSAPVDAPVLGVACGSLGVLTAVPAAGLGRALARVIEGDWTPRRLPALAIQPAHGLGQWAVNDLVAVRHGSGQLVASIAVDDELYARIAGDGVIVATALGSSAYSMAAGGPVLVTGTPAFVCTPLAMHGGNAPALVIPATSTLHLQLQPGFAGFDIEIDGHNVVETELDYAVTVHQDKVTLVAFGRRSLGLEDLRKRQLIFDSPRVLARDARKPPAR
jgi:NAD+ kinase